MPCFGDTTWSRSQCITSVGTLQQFPHVDVRVDLQLAAEIPNARFLSLPSANHLMLAEEPAWKIFLEEAGAFLGWQKTAPGK